MKKVLFVLVALCLISAPAFALSIKNSKHNLSAGALTQSGAGSIYSTNVNGLCVFCHTPHGASTDVKKAPLWNRDISSTGVAEYYNSTTLSFASQPAQVSAAIALTDALLCLSCHDGSSMSGGLVNPSNEVDGLTMLWNTTDAIADTAFTNIGSYGLGASGGSGNGDSDLRDDHPIAMVYDDVYTDVLKDGDFFATSNADVTALLRDGRVWCSSCHDVHDNAIIPFLRVDNTNSRLCLTCHNK